MNSSDNMCAFCAVLDGVKREAGNFSVFFGGACLCGPQACNLRWLSVACRHCQTSHLHDYPSLTSFALLAMYYCTSSTIFQTVAEITCTQFQTCALGIRDLLQGMMSLLTLWHQPCLVRRCSRGITATELMTQFNEHHVSINELTVCVLLPL